MNWTDIAGHEAGLWPMGAQMAVEKQLQQIAALEAKLHDTTAARNDYAVRVVNLQQAIAPFVAYAQRYINCSQPDEMLILYDPPNRITVGDFRRAWQAIH